MMRRRHRCARTSVAVHTWSRLVRVAPPVDAAATLEPRATPQPRKRRRREEAVQAKVFTAHIANMAETKVNREHLESADARHPNQDGSDEEESTALSKNIIPAPSNTYEGLEGLSDQEELRVVLLSVEVTNAETRTDSGGVYTAYSVETKRSDSSAPVSVWHRYSDFVELHRAILLSAGTDGRAQMDSELALPGKRIFGNMEPEFVAKRRDQLNAYMQRVLAVPKNHSVFALRSFLAPALRPDWPNRFGPIDLERHDLPHKSSITEWWYLNSHVVTDAGKQYSVFCCFFRVAKHIDAKTGKKSYAHALNWAITDVESGEYHTDVLLDKDSPQMVLSQLKKGVRVVKDKKIRDAMEEVLEKGNVPRPDRMFDQNPRVSKSSLDIDFQDAQMNKLSNGEYEIRACHGEDKSTGFRLTFRAQKPAIRHGANGVVKGHDGDDMFYYFIPRMSVGGHVNIKGKRHAVASGQGWYDHEFGGAKPEEGKDSMDYAWNWAAVQLDNGVDITAAVLINPEDQTVMETRTVVVGAKGEREQYARMSLEPVGEQWTSCRTFRTYPLHWKLKIPEANTELEISATVEDQEFMTLIAKPAFWEGRCDVHGTFKGQKVSGLCYVERNGFDEMPQLMDFFKAVGKTVRKSVRNMYPDKPTKTEVRDLIANEETEYYCQGVPPEILAKTLMEPVRCIADRGGKSWRSYGALACCDVVGGDSREFVQWLAMPEFMHVGSLIVDDIQDVSEERRGGPCAHLIYGEPLCINAGTAAYFMCEHLIKAPNLTEKQLNKVYQLYFACLRGGHAGQALDIYGLDYLMPEAVKEGKSDVLEERSLAIHMLKTAVPAGTLARMGALVGGGSESQIEAVGRYFESVGLAFQIMDDVLNLRGLYFGKQDEGEGTVASAEKQKKVAAKKKTLKVLGEDIMCGKVTMPVAKAMSRIPKREDRESLWNTIKSKPQDEKVVADTIAKLEACGALDACQKQADDLVEDAWKELDAAVPDSFSKMMLRSFGWFVVRR